MYGALRADPGSLEFMTNCLQQGALRRMIDEFELRPMQNPPAGSSVSRWRTHRTAPGSPALLSYSRSCDLLSFAVQFLHGGAASWACENLYFLEKNSLIACQIARGTGAPALLDHGRPGGGETRTNDPHDKTPLH